MHVSVDNLASAYLELFRQRPKQPDYLWPTELTSLGLLIDDERVGFDLWFPNGELKRGIQWLSGPYGLW